MGTVNIYDSGTDRKFTVTFDLKSAVLSTPVVGTVDYFIDISTSLKKSDGSSFGHYQIKDLTDTSLILGGVATDWTDLCNQFIKYFMDEAELVVSSSSSSNSSSSSSEGHTTSSSSSSDSSDSSLSSESSPSSGGYTSSSSSSPGV